MKSDDEAWNLFETLSENSMHHASSYSQSCRQSADVSIVTQELEEMKLAVQQLRIRASLIPPPPAVLNACATYASPLHDKYLCSFGTPFDEEAEESTDVAQAYQSQDNDQLSNNCNLQASFAPQAPPDPSFIKDQLLMKMEALNGIEGAKKGKYHFLDGRTRC